MLILMAITGLIMNAVGWAMVKKVGNDESVWGGIMVVGGAMWAGSIAWLLWSMVLPLLLLTLAGIAGWFLLKKTRKSNENEKDNETLEFFGFFSSPLKWWR